MDMSRIPVRSPEALEATVDGDRVLMSGRDFAYFGLVETAGAVWDRIDGQTSVGALVSALATEYSADESVVSGDVVDFISALDAAGLLDA